jgi:hypothetical protein
MNRSDARATLGLILGIVGVFLFFFSMAIIGGIRYMGAFGDLTSNPPKIENKSE